MLMLFLLTALQAAPGAPAQAIEDVQDPRLYVVGPNDVLTVTVYEQPQLSGEHTVEADGTFTLPLIGRVVAGGKTLRAVEAEVRDRLAAGFFRDPQVNVAVEQYLSQQVFLLGEIRSPGSLQLAGTMTLIEALARAGSTTERAGSEVLIVRSRDGAARTAPSGLLEGDAETSEVIRVNLESLQTGGLSQNVALRAGDTVFVPRAETVFVTGQVRSPGEYVLRAGMTVRQVLSLAGGLTDRGSTGRIQVIKQVDEGEITLDAELQDPVEAGDTINVRERFF